MSIIRVKKTNRYSVIPNGPFQNKEMSLEARGLLAYLLTKPDGWELMNSDLYSCSPAGRHKTDRVLKELKDFGHIQRFREQLPNGRFRWISEVYETPILTTIPPFSDDGSSDDGKQGYILNTDQTNTDLVNTTSDSDESGAVDEVSVSEEIPEETEEKAAMRMYAPDEFRPIDTPFGIFQRLAVIDASISSNQGRALRDVKAMLNGDKKRMIPAYSPEDILGCAAFIQQDPYRIENMIPLTTGVLIQKLPKWIQAGRPATWSDWRRGAAPAANTNTLGELHRDKTADAQHEPLMG